MGEVDFFGKIFFCEGFMTWYCMLLKGGGGMNYLPRRGKSEKLKKGIEVWSRGRSFSKRRAAYFVFNFFKVYHFYI